MRKLYVIDTCALISFYDGIFAHAEGYDGSPVLSRQTRNVIAEAINSEYTEVRLSIPTVVFLEIYEKWLRSEEFCRMFFYEVFTPLKKSENIEIRPIDRDVLENLTHIGGSLTNHELPDRLILASAVALCVPLITTDEKIATYVNETGILPCVMN